MASPELLQALKLAEQKRVEARRLRVERGLPVDQHLDPAKRKALQANIARLQKGREPASQPTLAEMASQLNQLPAHLGWHNVALAKLIRQATNEATPIVEQPLLFPEILVAKPDEKQLATNVKVYPSIALAILRQEHSAAARIYYLLRAIDVEGRGWLRIDKVRQQLTSLKSNLRIAKKKTGENSAWRNLRGLLHRGEGIFWTRDNQDRLWLHGAARIAATLECPQLYGEPVAIPLKAFVDGIQQVRSYLYASFHAGREKTTSRGRGVERPISQRCLQEVSRLSARTQTRYNKTARLKVRKNYTLGGRSDNEMLQERLYQNMGNAFTFKDVKGRHGRRGASYIASRLPNSYHTPLVHEPRGRHSKINDTLQEIDLVTNVGEEGAEMEISASSLLTQRGNGSEPDYPELFYQDSKRASKASMREQDVDHFFVSHVRSGRKRCGFWYELPAEEPNPKTTRGNHFA